LKKWSHRDIKLENIFLKEDFTPIIGDFGVACRYEDYQDNEIKKGTDHYWAPEIMDTNVTH
jgi:serine/threonine protein kinase